MNMKSGKLISLILILGLMAPAVAASGGSWNGSLASTTPIKLGLGDYVVFGNYTIQFYDINSNWSVATVAIESNGSTKLYFLNPGQTALYPSSPGYSIAVRLLKIIPSSGEIYVSIESPLRIFREGLSMVPNGSVVLNSLVSIKLDSVFTNGAVFTVKAGKTAKVEMTQGTSATLSCTLPKGITYSNCLMIHLNSVSNGVANLNLYLPAAFPVPFSIRRVSSANETRPEGRAIVYTPSFSGYVYTGSSIKVAYNGTNYSLILLNVSPLSATLRVKWNRKSEDVQIPVGVGAVRIKGLPIMVSLRGTDTAHSRAFLMVLTPEGTSVSVPFYPANVTVSFRASPRAVLLGQKIVVVINVSNRGPGDARDLSVAAPVPSGFRLISSSKVWMMSVLPAFSSMPALVYVLEPTEVGNFSIGQVTVVYTSNGTKTIKSNLLGGITVYSLPQLSVQASTPEQPVTMNGSGTFQINFKISAVGTKPAYEFIKDARLILTYPAGLSGPSSVYLGTVRAGETIKKEVTVRVNGKGVYTVGAYLEYTDPIGDQHTLKLGQVAMVDSIPPKVIVKTKVVKVYPEGQELVRYINETLKNGNSTAIASEIQGVIKPYLPRSVNYWIPVAIVFIVLTGVFLYETARYRSEARALRRKIERKRKPGGLPKKETEEEREIKTVEETVKKDEEGAGKSSEE